MPPKKCGEIHEVHEHDVSSSLPVWWHPEQAVELRVACRAEGVRTVKINGLACEHLYRLGVRGRQLIVGKVRMEIQSRHVFEQPKLSTSRNAVSGAISFVPLTTAGRSSQRLCTGTLRAWRTHRKPPPYPGMIFAKIEKP